MIMKIFTVFDRKVGAHLQPFYARSDGEAMRMLKETVLSGQSKLSQFPEDYHLYSLGEFDDQTGELLPNDRVEPVCSVVEVIEEVRRRLPVQLDLEEDTALSDGE